MTEILNGVLQYERAQVGIVSVLFALLMVILGIVLWKTYRKLSRSNKWIALVIVLVLCGVFTAYQITAKQYQNAILQDIAEQDTVSYTGEYVHDDYQKDSFYHNVYIVDDNGERVRLRYPDYHNDHQLYADFQPLPSGESLGTIVYSKRSKIVVGWAEK